MSEELYFQGWTSAQVAAMPKPEDVNSPADFLPGEVGTVNEVRQKRLDAIVDQIRREQGAGSHEIVSPRSGMSWWERALSNPEDWFWFGGSGMSRPHRFDPARPGRGGNPDHIVSQGRGSRDQLLEQVNAQLRTPHHLYSVASAAAQRDRTERDLADPAAMMSLFERHQQGDRSATERLRELGIPVQAVHQQYLGVPEGFRPLREYNLSGNVPDQISQHAQSREVDPLYTASDPIGQLSRMSRESRYRLMVRMQQAGFEVDLTSDVNPANVSALEAIMSYANMNGITWDKALSDLQRQAQEAYMEEEEDLGPDMGQLARTEWERMREAYLRDPYLPPSYESLASEVRQLFRKNIGRDPREYEMELLAEELSSNIEAAFTQQQDVAEQTYLAQAAHAINAAYEGDFIEVPEVAIDGEERVDPQAIFDERFHELYGPTMEHADEQQAHGQYTNQLLSSLGLVNQQMMRR